jgi:hypothetical protein
MEGKDLGAAAVPVQREDHRKRTGDPIRFQDFHHRPGAGDRLRAQLRTSGDQLMEILLLNQDLKIGILIQVLIPVTLFDRLVQYLQREGRVLQFAGHQHAPVIHHAPGMRREQVEILSRQMERLRVILPGCGLMVLLLNFLYIYHGDAFLLS